MEMYHQWESSTTVLSGGAQGTYFEPAATPTFTNTPLTTRSVVYLSWRLDLQSKRFSYRSLVVRLTQVSTPITENGCCWKLVHVLTTRIRSLLHSGTSHSRDVRSSSSSMSFCPSSFWVCWTALSTVFRSSLEKGSRMRSPSSCPLLSSWPWSATTFPRLRLQCLSSASTCSQSSQVAAWSWSAPFSIWSCSTLISVKKYRRWSVASRC